jgi:hypothetical protein
VRTTLKINKIQETKNKGAQKKKKTMKTETYKKKREKINKTIKGITFRPSWDGSTDSLG